MASSPSLARAERLVAFLNRAPSPFHAVDAVRARLAAGGFTELKERDRWAVAPNGKYFVTRNQSTIVAFAVGGRYAPGNGFSIIGAHTDSPCLKVKPKPKNESQGYLQLGVELYGGGIWHTWFDRDLGLAGRVIVRDGATGGLRHQLVRIDTPLLRIPTLAIHLDRAVNTEGFKFNLEKELLPMFGLRDATDSKNGDERLPAPILKLLADQLQCAPAEIGDVELCLFDTLPATLGGVHNEFIFSARLDNLFNAFTATEALVESADGNGLATDPLIRVVALFDNEEVGSDSAYGAGSLLMESLLRRLSVDEHNPTSFEQAIARSFLISADQAHAVHPNYAGKHEDNHRPKMNTGVVIKQNANQRYATTAATAAVLRSVAAKAGVVLQDFVVRNDSSCGSTIGPILSSGLGLRTIDVGCPQLSMHSIRETGGSHDVAISIDLFKAFFTHFAEVDSTLVVD